MKFDATNTFIDALKKWDENTQDNKATDMASLICLIGFKIGVKEIEEDYNKGLVILRDRMVTLIDNDINETFLVSSMTNLITGIFKRFIYNHADAILFNEEMVKKMPDSTSFKGMAERVRTTKYSIGLKNDLYRWQEIVIMDLSEEKFEQWENDYLLEKGKMSGAYLDKMEEKFGNMSMREIYNLENNR